MSTKCIISWYGYSENAQYLQLDNLTNKWPKRAKVNICNKIIKIIWDKTERVCIWRYDILDWHSDSCPNKSRIDNKYETCPDCRKYIWFNPAFYNTNNISKKQKEYNNQPHNVYLAHFWSGIVKVWISHHKRTQIRLME